MCLSKGERRNRSSRPNRLVGGSAYVAARFITDREKVDNGSAS
ncbi:hypothetical protein COLO4_29647 [Corchorus olitorius]|uniref:Uncharacterized protein n=1 Tax=Corchorus olitorius TaxID=93759 RepID=A0A1R3HDQ8_9ROSI|nr:hypothetical protein COLO4_29647 [Corchorus olitorius]